MVNRVVYKDYLKEKREVDKTINDNIKALDGPINEVKRAYNQYLKSLRELYLIEENISTEAKEMYLELRKKYECLRATHNIDLSLNVKTANAIAMSGKILKFDSGNWTYYLYKEV